MWQPEGETYDWEVHLGNCCNVIFSEWRPNCCLGSVFRGLLEMHAVICQIEYGFAIYIHSFENDWEMVCALDFLIFSLFLCILCYVVYNLPLLPFALEQYIQSNNELYLFYAQSIPLQTICFIGPCCIVALYMIYVAYQSTPTFTSSQWLQLRKTLNCICIILILMWDVIGYWLNKEIMCFFYIWYMWNFKSLFHMFMCNVFSL
jgi:hypothetical protein